MLCRDIIQVIETTYPKHAALEWDNVGLLVGRTDKAVKRIYVALDATDDIIDDAISKNVDMLITHHPLLFTPLKTITDEHFISNRVVKLLQHDISYYAMHTNYDVLGMADLSGNILGLSNMEVLEVTDDEAGIGIGKVGMLPMKMTVAECCELVKERFCLETVKVFGDVNKIVERVAVSPGSGKGMADIALAKQAEVLITGDISHHEGIDAVAQGIVIIDAGHYGLEHIFVDDIVAYLNKHFSDIMIQNCEHIHPFQVI